MKNHFKTLYGVVLIFLLLLEPSCAVKTPSKHHDNGKHVGWYKDSKAVKESNKAQSKDNGNQNNKKKKNKETK